MNDYASRVVSLLTRAGFTPSKIGEDTIMFGKDDPFFIGTIRSDKSVWLTLRLNREVPEIYKFRDYETLEEFCRDSLLLS